MAAKGPFADIVQSLRLVHAWGSLGARDVARQNHGTLLGPLWTVVGQVAFILGIAYLFSSVMGRTFEEFLPHVGLGYIFFSSMTRQINEAANVFQSARGLINELPLPIWFHFLRYQYKLLMMLVLDLVIIVPMLLLFGMSVQQTWWMAALGVPLVLSALYGFNFLIAVLCLVRTSIRPLIEIAMRFLFFFTPIIWTEESARAEALGVNVTDINPFAIALRIMRDPIIYGPPEAWEWGVIALLLVVGWIAGLLSFSWVYRRIPLLVVRG